MIQNVKLCFKIRNWFSNNTYKCTEQKINQLNIEWHNDKSICIVLCSKGYPEKYENNIIINIENVNLKENQFLIMQAQTRWEKYFPIERVLNIVARSRF